MDVVQRVRIDRIRALGIPVYEVHVTSLALMPESVRRLGELAGTAEAAGKRADELRAELDALAERYRGRAPLRVLYQIWDRPIYTIGGRHVITDHLRSLIQVTHGVHDTENRGHDPETRKGIGHGLDRVLGGMFFFVHGFNILIEKIVHVVLAEVGRERDLHRVTEEIHGMVVLEKAGVGFENFRGVGFFDVFFNRLRTVFTENLKQLEHELKQFNVVLLLRTLARQSAKA